MSKEVMKILRMIEESKITATEGAELLRALKTGSTSGKDLFMGPDITRKVSREVKEGLKDIKGWQFFKWGGGTKIEEVFERELEVSPNSQLFLENFSGDITVKSWHQPRVKIEAKKYARGSTEEEARQNVHEIGVDIHQKENTIRIETKIPSSNLFWGRGVDYNLSVPKDIHLNLKSKSGDIKTEDICGNVKINTKSGDVKIGKIKGNIEAGSLSGDVIIDRIKGDLIAKSLSGDVKGKDIVGEEIKISAKSGDIDFSKLWGNLTIECFSDDIDLANADCSGLRATTKSGDIDISGLIKPEGSYFLKALSGDIRVKVPADTSARIETTARSGDVRCKLPVKIEKKNNHELCGVLGEGKAKIELTSLSGDISLESKE